MNNAASINTTLAHLHRHRMVAIIRGAQPADVLAMVNALYAGGIRAVEITLNSANAIDVIREVAAAVSSSMLVGAGTVLNAASALAALDAGAQFIIAPSFDIETISVTKARNAVSIPGAYTPTEILKAYEAGADIVKVFPASNPQYIRDIRGPLAHIPLMPTGGVNLSNIRSFMDAGAVAAGVGSALTDTSQPVTSQFLAALTERAAAFVKAIN